MQIEWPEKKNLPKGISGKELKHPWTSGYNAAIDACKEAFDKAQGKELVALELNRVAEFLWRLDNPDVCYGFEVAGWQEIYLKKAEDFISNFGQPSPTPGKWIELDQIEVRRVLIEAGVKAHIAGALSSIICVKFATNPDNQIKDW